MRSRSTPGASHWIPSPWDGRVVALLGAGFLAAYVFVFVRLLGDATKGAVLGANVIAAIQVFICVVVAGFLIARPRNRRYAWVALGLGAFITAVSLLAATAGAASGIHTVVRSPLFFLAVIALVLFDTGRVQSRIDRRITLPMSALAVALYIALVLVTPALPGGAVGFDCSGACPATGLNAVDAPGAATFLANAYLVVRTIAMAAAAVALIQRYRSAGGTFRVMMRPVAWIGALYMAAGVLAGLIDLLNLGDSANAAVTPLLFLTRIAIPLAIGAGVLLGEQRRGGTLERDFAAIRAASGPTEVQQHLRSLLHDRSLVVVMPGDEPPDADRAELTELRGQDGRLVATLCHRAGLEADQPVAFNIAVPAATLALKQLELEGQMDQMRDHLADAKQQALMAGDEERRRIEQDLHDGAQMRVILLRGRIEQLASRTATDDAGSQADVDTMLGEADALLAEIRGMSAGMRRVPPGQLAHALRDLAGAAPLSARIRIEDLGEVSPDVEQAVFYCVSEALQNAAKHAGARASVVIEVERDGDDIVFAVSDDGVGIPADLTPGRGLSGMADRVESLGGCMDPIQALPFGGATVRGRIPAAAAMRRTETA
jgi:signal transduction histidine kinase